MIDANNDLDTADLFEARKDYKENTYPEEAIMPLDMWYSNPLYGKINRTGEAVYLLPGGESMSAMLLVNQESPVWCINFVARAFEDMKKEYDTAAASGRIELMEKIDTLEVKRGWINLESKYRDYLLGLQDGLIHAIRYHHIHITEFKHFLRFYYRHIKDMAATLPVTRSSFVTSRMVPQNCSGLVLDLALEPYDDDEPKKAVLDDRQFEYFSNLAARYGFYIDKNAPWRLIANVSSTRMQEYMERFGIAYEPGSATDLFETYYYKTIWDEPMDLSGFLINTYNEFISMYPTQRIVKLCGNVINTTYKQRRPMPTEGSNAATSQGQEKYGDRMFWLEQVLKTKIFEFPHLTKIRKSDIMKIMRESKAINKIYGFRPAIANVERELREFNALYEHIPDPMYDSSKKTVIRDLTKIVPKIIRDNDRLLPDAPKHPSLSLRTRNKIDNKKLREEKRSMDDDTSTPSLPVSGY